MCVESELVIWGVDGENSQNVGNCPWGGSTKGCSTKDFCHRHPGNWEMLKAGMGGQPCAGTRAVSHLQGGDRS